MQLLDHFPDAVIISDGTTRVRYANSVAQKLLKLSPETLAEIPLLERVHPGDRKKVKRYATLLKERKQMTTKRRFLRGDGAYIFLERHTSLLADGTQLSVCRDISSFETSLQRADMFVALAAHELRGPLSLVKTYMDHLRLVCENETSPDGVLQLLGKLDEQIEWQLRLIQDFLELSRIGKGKLSFQMGSVDLGELVAAAVRQVHQLTQREFILPVRAAGAPIAGDKDRLYQVFENLLTNATKFSIAPNPVEITIVSEGAVSDVSIRDHGIGIKAEDQDRIFEPFYQVKKTSRTGLGLGLFIASQIIKQHHGILSVRNAPDGGSIFSVRLPHASAEGVQ